MLVSIGRERSRRVHGLHHGKLAEEHSRVRPTHQRRELGRRAQDAPTRLVIGQGQRAYEELAEKCDHRSGVGTTVDLQLDQLKGRQLRPVGDDGALVARYNAAQKLLRRLHLPRSAQKAGMDGHDLGLIGAVAGIAVPGAAPNLFEQG